MGGNFGNMVFIILVSDYDQIGCQRGLGANILKIFTRPVRHSKHKKNAFQISSFQLIMHTNP